MSSNQTSRPEVSQILSGLKGFQRDTVDYVYRRLYQDSDQVSRFLIADEVGLGKTLVARGVIAKAVDHMWEEVDRIDIVYICSNQDIAQQNIDRLNITQNSFRHASRATLLPIRVQQLRKNKINFVSLTPNTSFNISAHAGLMNERVILLRMLRNSWSESQETLSNILRSEVLPKRWVEHLHWSEQYEPIDEELESAFLNAVEREPKLKRHYDELASEIGPHPGKLPWETRRERDGYIGQLRSVLAKSSLAALEPDLIILDEFQRFKYLIEGDNEVASLAKELFNYHGFKGQPVKVILLSATPYKMYTLQGEEGENHYEDFLLTVGFLLDNDENKIKKLKSSIEQYRSAFLGLNSLDDIGKKSFSQAKTNIEATLRKVIVRTERLAVSEDRNGMLKEHISAGDKLKPEDLISFVHLDTLATFLGADDQVEYWKSSAYPLNLMEDYKLKKLFEKAYKQGDNQKLYNLLRGDQSHLLSWEDIQKYQEIDPGNARMRDLQDQTVMSGNWQLLWLPANLPYYFPEGPFSELSNECKTKTLVFSAWRVVPKVIATLLSYETERQIFRQEVQDFDYEELTRKRRGLLRFAFNRGRLTGMSVFTLIYPCLTLAEELDPLAIAKQNVGSNLSSSFFMLERIKLRLRLLLEKATARIGEKETGPIDESWYWFAPLLLDRYYHLDEINSWFSTDENDLIWQDMLNSASDEDDESSFKDHVQEFKKIFRNPSGLGKRPKDLIDVLARIALASPAVTSLRSIMRVTGAEKPSSHILAAAAYSGLGFRTLFNQSEVVSLLQLLNKDEPEEEKIYWRSVLRYSVQGNLQSVLDEYLHILFESLGQASFHDPDESSMKLGQTLQQALSLRSPSLRFDEINTNRETRSITLLPHSIRCRYAIRFGDERSETIEKGMRDTDVRIAFNSPFRPFVLATTSIGQEGLDFHQYCHRVIHWNLPINPVDLEQREGRIHRYKGHVIRRNLVEHYHLDSIVVEKGKLVDPWQQIFHYASLEDKGVSNGLVPYWVYEKGPYRIERFVPMLPLSREYGRLENLKKALVAYRSVIGQPRQQELLESLTLRFPRKEDLKAFSAQFSIDLSPPRMKQ